MRIEHLQYLTEIAKYQSISTAAKKLYISQTGLSAIVNSIEAELNIQIFVRSNKGTLLTPEGERALELIEDILSKNDELHFLYSDNSPYSQIINLGVFPSGTHALSRYLANIWMHEHPHIHLHIYEIGYTHFLNCVKEHTAKIVIGADDPDHLKNRYSSDGKIYLETLHHDHFCVLVSSQSDLAEQDHLHIDDLFERHLVLTHNFPDPQDKPIGYILHKFRYFTVVNNLEVAKDMLIDNPQALMIVPALSVYKDTQLENGALKLLEVRGFDTNLAIFMLCDITSKLSIHESKLMQDIRKFFASLPPAKQ